MYFNKNFFIIKLLLFKLKNKKINQCLFIKNEIYTLIEKYANIITIERYNV